MTQILSTTTDYVFLVCLMGRLWIKFSSADLVRAYDFVLFSSLSFYRSHLAEFFHERCIHKLVWHLLG